MNKIIFLIAGTLSFNLLAAETHFGRIVELKGEGFISYKGKTREIRKGDAIEIGAEVVVEQHGQITFTDNADHRFHLGNASSAMLFGNSVELRAGDIWIQSINKTDDYQIKTANAVINYSGGEAVLSYDSLKGKTQLMVINGLMKLSNLRALELNLNVAEGHFSFIDNAYDEGAPRDPTPVGEKTYTGLIAQFVGITPLDKNSAAVFKDKKEGSGSRAIASEAIDPAHKMLEEYKASLLVKPAIKKAVTKKLSSPKMAPTDAMTGKTIVHIYGQKKTPVMKNRAPASVVELEVPKDEVVEPKSPKPYSLEYKQKVESDNLIEALNKL